MSNISDYGYYGKNGDFEDHELPVENCKCGRKGTLHCAYDDTPGYRETAYRLRCTKCGTESSFTSEIDDVISTWNEATKEK